MARKRGFILGPTIHKIFVQLAEAHKRSGGVFNNTLPILELSAFLKEHPEYAEETLPQAKRLVRKYLRVVRPRPASPGGLFHPERVVPAGPNLSCLMKNVVPVILDFWKANDTEKKRLADAAFRQKNDYWRTRKRAFTRTGLPDLGEIETVVYGYKLPPVPTMPDELLLDDDDDDGEDS